jgi:hypothetical protein
MYQRRLLRGNGMSDLMKMTWADAPKVTGDTPYCVCCGKALKGTKNRVVEVVDGGENAVRPGTEVDTNDPGYMGQYDVGPDCAKKYLPGFTSAPGEE